MFQYRDEANKTTMPFQFGAAPGPAPGAAAPAGGFSFSAASSGGTSSAASSSTGSGTSFSFGSNQASSTATSSTTPGGFSFGGTQAPSNGTGSGTSAGFAASSTAQASPAPGGFTFGTTSNAPAQSSNNPATKPGPSFGSTSAPPSGSTPVPSDKTQNPTGGPAPTLGPAGGFTLGGSATSATSTAAPNATAPAPSKEGFSFGAPGTGQSSASAPTGGPSAGGFAFGASSGSSTTTAATSAPPTGGFSFGSTAPGTSVTPAAGGTPPLALGTNAPSGGGFGFGVSAVTPAPAPGDGLLEVPLFETSFPRLKAHSKVRSLVGKISNNEREGRYAGEDLVNQLRIGDNTLGALLSNPQTLDLKQKDMGVRQRLAANPTVKLYNKPAGLTAQMAQEVFEIADDLRVSEIEALSLYAEASKSDTRKWLEVTCDASFLDKAMAKEPSTQRLILGNDVRKGAKELYFLERLSLMKTILFLLQNRLNAEPVGYLMVATDELIKHDLVGNLIKLIRQSTVLMVDLEAELKELPTTLSTFTVSASAGSKKFPFAAVLIEYLRQERKIAAECLFYLTYHTQCTPVEVATMVDLLKDLTNGTSEKDSGLPVLDPFKDVPDAYQKQPLQWQGPFTTAPPLKDKDALDWQRELIQTTWTKNGKAQLLECVGIVVVAILSAIGTKNVLVDRTSHLPNDFGEVSVKLELWHFYH